MNSKLRIAILTTDGRSLSHKWKGRVPSIGTAPRALLAGFSELDDIEVHVVYCLREPLGNPVDFMPGIHFHQVIVPKWGWMSSLYLGCIGAVRKCLAKIQPDIVHGQGTERDCAMEAIHSGFPNVLTIHGIMREIQRLGFQGHALYGPLASLLESHALKRTVGVFCNSTYTESLIAPRAKHTWLVPNPIRSAFFAVRESPKKANAIPQVLNVGLISPRKRQLELLQTAGELVSKGHTVHMIFVGDLSESSDYGKAFITELRSAEAAGYASHAGVLGVTELIELMDQSDGFIHFPSEEAFGLVVAEAIARGLKFFGSNLGGIRDIASGISGAELHDDFDSLCKGLAAWLESGAPAPENAAQEIAERYHPRVIAKRHVEIYREVLKR
jgi:glycosyltransferase involved in cell wall biosynthesis